MKGKKNRKKKNVNVLERTKLMSSNLQGGGGVCGGGGG